MQEYLLKTKEARRKIVRYTQLIDDDPQGDFIGTLLSTNEQVLAALSLYDRWSLPVDHDSDDEAEAAELAATAQGNASVPATRDAAEADLLANRTSKIDINYTGQLERLQGRQQAEIERYNRTRRSQQDMTDLMFDAPASSNAGLQEPMKPRHVSDIDSTDLEDGLSDFSDYDSSDEETHRRNATSSSSSAMPSVSGSKQQDTDRAYAQFLLPGEEQDALDNKRGSSHLLRNDKTANEEEDPFADPFADQDQGDVMTPGINEKQRLDWRQV